MGRNNADFLDGLPERNRNSNIVYEYHRADEGIAGSPEETHAVTARHEGNVIGTLTWRRGFPEDPEYGGVGMVRSIFVEPSHRNTGIVEGLIRTAINHPDRGDFPPPSTHNVSVTPEGMRLVKKLTPEMMGGAVPTRYRGEPSAHGAFISWKDGWGPQR